MSDPYPFMTAEWHRDAWRVLSTGPQPGDPNYTPDPTEWMD